MTDATSNEDGAEAAGRREIPSGLAAALDRLSVIVAGLTLAAMMFMTLFDVLGRYFLNAPLGFAFEMTQVGMAIVVFAALPSVTLRSAHVTAGLFENLLRGRAALARDLFWYAVTAACCFFIAFKLSTLAARFLRYGDRTPVLDVPMGWIAWFGVAGLCLAGLAALAAGVMRLRRGAPSEGGDA